MRRDFLSSLGDKAKSPVESITAEDVKDYLAGLAKKGLSSKSIANHLKILRVPFAEHCRLGKLAFNPAAAVKAPKVTQVKRMPFTQDEISAIFKACNGFDNGDQWKTAIALGYYAALRLGMATGLKWGDVDFQRKKLIFTAEKSGDVEILMHPELERRLLSLPVQDNPEAFVTPNLVCG